MLLEINIDDSLFVPLSIYNAKKKHFHRDFSVIFDSFLEVQGDTKFEKTHFDKKNNSNQTTAERCQSLDNLKS